MSGFGISLEIGAMPNLVLKQCNTYCVYMKHFILTYIYYKTMYEKMIFTFWGIDMTLTTKERKNEIQKAYYRRHKEYYKEYRKQYRAKHREAINALYRERTVAR